MADQPSTYGQQWAATSFEPIRGTRCDHPESARLLESRSQPAPGGGRLRETVMRCQRCGAVLYTDGQPTTEPEEPT